MGIEGQGMDDRTCLEDRFEESRAHLRSVAYRILGSSTDADDAVQEAWIRLQRADTAGVHNIRGWLTTVVSRVCLDMLRSRRARPEDPNPLNLEQSDHPVADDPDPEHEALMSESIGLALLVVMDTLSPPERLAFVLHDMFAVPFSDIAVVLDSTADAARQHASRARRRVQGGAVLTDADATRHREMVEAFLAASRNGKLDALVSMLHPDAAFHADAVARRAGVEEVLGARSVADVFAGRAKAAELAVIDDHPGAVWRQRRVPRALFRFTIVKDRITDIELVMDADTIGRCDIIVPDDNRCI
jgi:RNA polymerase sigma-70 factor (ECF subfamily)